MNNIFLKVVKKIAMWTVPYKPYKKISTMIFSNKNYEIDPNKIITLYPKTEEIKGRVLFSYLAKPLLFQENDKIFDDHSNKWESREIVRIFNKFGYIVDGIDYNNFKFYPTFKYDIVFDIHFNLQRLIPFLNKDCKKILHLTGSYPCFSNEAEITRVEALEKRKGVLYSPKRIVDQYLYDRSLKFADHCSLIGNDCTLNTFPEWSRSKIQKVTVSSSRLDYIKSRKDFVPEKREFLWFFGSGAVHKGLDLVLDVFSKHRNLILNIVGDLKWEKDFCKAFDHELTKLPNIRYHGFLAPNSYKFKRIIKNVFCFVAPSCSEAISSSVATCLQLGLFPIISRNTGINLPENCGIYLGKLSIEEVEKSVLLVHLMNKIYLEDQIEKTQNYAIEAFSRRKFSGDMENFLRKILR